MEKDKGTTNNCRVCGVGLEAGVNWYMSDARSGSRICKTCLKKLNYAAKKKRTKERGGAAYLLKDPRSVSIHSARHRAKKKGMECTLTLDNCPPIPTHCPVLGVEMRYGGGNEGSSNSPSLDRLDNSKGYTPDNVIWVSHEANTIKGRSHWMKILRVGEFYRDLELQRTRKEAA